MQETIVLDESMIMLLPAAMLSLCAGSLPFPHYYKDPFMSNSSTDASEDTEDLFKVFLKACLFFFRVWSDHGIR